MLLTKLGVSYTKPVPTYQENISAIIVAVQGGNFKRLKHLLVRELFVQERVKCGPVLVYIAMPADMLIKPLSAIKLNKHMNF